MNSILLFERFVPYVTTLDAQHSAGPRHRVRLYKEY